MARQRPRDPVQFTRESAERIANVVRAAETAPAPASPLTFERLIDGRAPKAVRAATFSGAWPIGSSKSVTFTNLPTATANVQNLSWPITEAGYSNEPCIVGKDGTAWYLLVPRLETATAVFATMTQEVSIVTETVEQTIGIDWYQTTVASGFQTFGVLSDISIAATLNTNDCSITIAKTNSTASIKVVTDTTTAFFASGTSTVAVCGATATAVMITETATTNILRLRLP